MLLAIDISNTGIKFGLYQGKEMRARWRIATVREKTADEYAMLLGELLRHAGYGFEAVDVVMVSCVVPPLTPVFQDLALHYCAQEAIVIDHTMHVGVRLLTDNPWETGTDRIMSTLAAHRLYGGPAIVIQCGTATSFDVVSAEGDFLGGAIAPGMGISAEALARVASRLYQVELKPPPQAIGRNTIHSMQSGIVFGHVGLIEGMVARLRQELPGGERAKVIAHGGLAEIIAQATPVIEVVNQFLILEGLRLAYEYLREHA